MECPVPRTSRFAVSRLLRFSVNSRRQPVTARHSPSQPVRCIIAAPAEVRCACQWLELRCACQGLELRCASGSSIHLPVADPRRTPESSVHFSSFDAPGNRFQAGNGRYAHRSSQSASGFYKCIKDHQAHADSLSASQLFSCTDDRKTRQRPGHHRPRAQKTGPEVDASGPESHLLAGDGAVQRWSTTGH